jgi:hypothetical protein
VDLGNSASRNSALLACGEDDLRAFVTAFQSAQTYSIDAFLSRRLDLATVGKGAIAQVLLEGENLCNLVNEDHADHWYQYLVNELATEGWDTFDPSWLSIVTFNYDRSLEVYLCLALRHIFDKSESEIVERLRTVEVVHVYGSLGSPWPGDDDYLPFKTPPEHLSETIQASAKRIKVIPEGRDDDDTLVRAQALLANASRICFLGFGFDSTNIRRLGAPNTFLPAQAQLKRVVATTIGMTSAEVVRAARRVLSEPGYASRGADWFRNLNCIGLLRESLILD